MGVAAGGLGVGGIVIALIAYFLGFDPGAVLQMQEPGGSPAAQGGTRGAPGDPAGQFVELQADCYAGVWGHHAGAMNQLQAGDVDEALAAATAIGDDRLQQQARGRVVPEAFTHGSSEQRRRWLERGLRSGDPGDCDTFSAASL